VVREDKMHFWNVPRLGSFMAVPLVYKSALSVASFQLAYDDYQAYTEKTFRQEEEKAAHEESQAALRADAEANGTEFLPEEKQWEEIVLPSIKTENKKFVVCIDSMGQDRVFNQEERGFILETIHKYRTHWENFERDKLEMDRDALVAEKKKDEEIITEEYLVAQKEKEEALVQAKVDPPQEESASKAKEADSDVELMSFETRQLLQTQV